MAETEKPHKDDKLVIKDSTREDSPEAKPPEEPKEKPNAPAPNKKTTWTRKKIALVVSAVIVVIIAVLLLIPATRYGIVGAFVSRDVSVTLRDSKTNKPVSNVAVEIGETAAITNANGQATLKSIPVGVKTLTLHKKYYKDQSSQQTVPIFGNNPSLDFTVEATGRQVPVKIINKISQQPVEGADITADGTSSKTDKNGEATMVLPADKASMGAKLTNPGYNPVDTNVTITDQQDDKNTFSIVPSGKLYFLSNRSGTIDVMKSDLDGSNVESVVKGTGKEDQDGTVLLASRDWKYLALKARRDSEKPKLYIIETSSGKLSLMDEGDVDFTPVGWYNNYFVYTLNRSQLKNWEPKQFALKSYNATTGSLNILDETAAAGSDQTKYAYETLANVYILKNQIFYTKSWNTGELYMLDGKSSTVNTVQPDGGNKKIVKSFSHDDAVYFSGARLYKPNEVYLAVSIKNELTFWEYENGSLVQEKGLTQDKFYSFYPTYLASPSGNNAFWYEQRDGKNTLFVGDAGGDNGKEVANLSEYVPYGWYTDNYMLVSKEGSELYIISRSNPATPLKVTDYQKPQINFYGYGYGYGGF